MPRRGSSPARARTWPRATGPTLCPSCPAAATVWMRTTGERISGSLTHRCSATRANRRGSRRGSRGAPR
eukprot:7552148-Alexandrium_andersonii.AAC.1